ncbi:MAG: aspartate-semialdehyde dehydrogenase [Oscillospiraceae bacterium]|nr:aspartate-semialdehyde dehydrogenase [Oscillospiraceae bacterium]
MKRYNVGIIGATGMVGQRFVSCLDNHPWFSAKVLAASPRSAGKLYKDLMESRWGMPTAIPGVIGDTVVLDADADAEKIASEVDFVFCAVDMPKAEILALEEKYAKLECPVISSNGACRSAPDVPMIIPEINPEHAQVIDAQRRRLGTARGFIAVKSNCSLQSYVPALHPLMDCGVTDVLVCTYQAISGAGKTFATWPEMVDNVIPYIGGEEEKSEIEPLKIWGSVTGGAIVNAASPNITTQCVRVPVTDGHLAAVFARFDKKIAIEEIKERWNAFVGEPQRLGLPSAPKKFLHYFEEPDRPQTRLERDLENAMAVSIGRLREDSQYDVKFICLSHNTVRGAAGGSVLTAELLCAKGYL